MSLWLQNLLTFAIVAACGGWVVWQGVASFFGRKSKLGSCCSKGCAAQQPAKPTTERIVFLPVEMLGKRK
jgi:hypothetical protein